MTPNLSDRRDPAEVCRRFHDLYVAAVADVLDERGLWHQCMNSDIRPIAPAMKVSGFAYTVLGRPERSTERSIRLGARMIDQLSPYEVAVFDCSGDTTTGHWGELLTNGAMRRSSVGAVIDGGVRDTAAILSLGFPTFCRYRAPRDAKGRWNVTDMGIEITAGGVRVQPGDFILGDDDGVVVIPRESIDDVLVEAEAVARTEDEVRQRIRAGESVGDLYDTYERF